MKKLRNILFVLALVLNAYVPAAAACAAILDLNFKIYSPAALAAITFGVTLLALIFSFLCGSQSLLNKISAPVITLLSIADFSVFLIFADDATATVFCILTYAASVALAVKSFSFLLVKILFPIVSTVLGVATFLLSVILALALALGNRSVTASSLSPDGRYRAEITSQSAISKNGYSLIIYDTENEVRLPFIRIFPDGEAIYSKSEIDPDGLSWENSNTVKVNGERFTVGD